MARINVTKAFLPDKAAYLKYLDAIWESAYLTNNGPLLQELEKNIKEALGITNLMVCGNGTIVLQMAIKALSLKKEVITTPFSYVATTNAIIWENCTPVFADIDPVSLCIDPESIALLITPQTEAILATHVYGYPCDVKAIENIAQKHGLKVIYDAAHAFGCRLNGQSLLNYGNISTCSFHATKLFHTVEGGCIHAADPAVYDNLYKLRQFGHIYDDYYLAGVNGKNSEFHAAMGLCVLPELGSIIRQRREISERYDALLQLRKPACTAEGFEYNYGYYPIILDSEQQLLRVKAALEADDIFPRRYFYPSLNTLSFVKDHYRACPVSEALSLRALCLPLYPGLDMADVERISGIVSHNL